MKKKKLILLSLIFLSSCGSSNSINGLTFRTYESKKGNFSILISCDENAESIQIPKYYDNFEVRSFAKNSFKTSTKLKEVTYEGTIEDWYFIAFDDEYSNPMCYGASFYTLENDKKVQPKTLTIPNTSLSGINNDTLRIQKYQYYGISSLEEVVIPYGDYNVEIYARAFYNCSSLRKITIPNNLLNVQDEAFTGCNSLDFNEYDNGLYIGSDENPYMILIKGKNNNIVNCEIHEDTRFIHSRAFENCSKLKSITIPSNVEKIGNNTFENCTSLETITFNERDKDCSIGSKSFLNCSVKNVYFCGIKTDFDYISYVSGEADSDLTNNKNISIYVYKSKQDNTWIKL